MVGPAGVRAVGGQEDLEDEALARGAAEPVRLREVPLPGRQPVAVEQQRAPQLPQHRAHPLQHAKRQPVRPAPVRVDAQLDVSVHLDVGPLRVVEDGQVAPPALLG